MLKFQVQTAPFKEQPTAEPNTTPHEYDITLTRCLSGVEGSGANDTLIEYCHNLLFKIVTLPKSRIKPFLQYQCEQLTDPFVWLNKFEKLIDLNREGFTTKDHNIKIEKALVLIELLRNEIESGKQKTKFNFKKVKQQIQTYKTPEEKMSYLLEQKTEYLQNKPLIQDPTQVPFDIQCDLELNLLKTKRKLSKKKDSPSPVGEGVCLQTGEGLRSANLPTNHNLHSKKNVSPLSTGREGKGVSPKFRINTNLNQFIDIFYQLMHEKHINNLPYLEASTNGLAELISTSFVDKDGNEISPETIKTILRPSRFDKRPKGDLKILIN
jgi:hypothetical protein